MPITTKIRRQGGAAIMTIPPVLLKQMQADVGAQLSLAVVDGELIAKPLQTVRKRYPLSVLLRGAEAMKGLNAQTQEAQDGLPIGHEIA